MTVEIKDCKLSIWQRVSGFRWVGFGVLVRERCLFKMQLPRSGNKPLGACARETLALQSLTPMPGGSTANVAFWTEKKLASNAAARLRKRVPRRALPPCPWRTDQVLKWLACAREMLASQSLAPMPWRTDKVLRWEAPVPNIHCFLNGEEISFKPSRQWQNACHAALPSCLWRTDQVLGWETPGKLQCLTALSERRRN